MRISHTLVSLRHAFLFLLVTSIGSSYGADLEYDVYRDIRFLGRGNTGVSSVNDSAALFYNPAGLASDGGYSFKILNPTVGTNHNVYESAKTGFDYKNDDDSLNSKFSPYMGKQLGARYSVFPSISIPYFAVGYFNTGFANMTFRNPVNPEFVVRARYDQGYIFGGGLPLGNRLALGVSLKYLNRNQIFSDITGADLLLASSTAMDRYLKTGKGWGVNVGGIARFPFSDKSMINVGTAVEDVGFTKLTNPKSKTTQLRQQMIWNAGMSYEYDSPNVGFKALYDMKHLTASKVSYTKKIHMGTEISFLRTDLRFGFNQGYYTAGLSIRIIPFMYFDAVTYGEEVDSSAGLREDRVYMVGFSYGLQLKNGSGKKQRLNLDNIR